MIIKASAAIRQNYNEISELCKKTHEPVYLTKNGEGDLVVMDIQDFERQKKQWMLEAELLASERLYKKGGHMYSVEDLDQALKQVAEGTGNYGKTKAV